MNPFSHIDLRVRHRERAKTFYTPLMLALGFRGPRDGEEWTSYDFISADAENARPWFGFIEDPHVLPGSTRVAFAVAVREDVERIAALLLQIGAQVVEGPDESEGYYAVFFEDPDGNKLEVCVSPQ